MEDHQVLHTHSFSMRADWVENGASIPQTCQLYWKTSAMVLCSSEENLSLLVGTDHQRGSSS